MKQTTGTWDPTVGPAHFLAGTATPARTGKPHPWVLVPVDVLVNASGRIGAVGALVDSMIDRGVRVMFDSGVFWLTSRHAALHRIRLADALNLHPQEIDDWDWLLEGYGAVVERYGTQAWGYVELDQGGADRKRETRALVESTIGIVPIPVYHPLGDGWDYFDELAQGYDRVAVGNLVQAPTTVRRALFHTMAQRRREYPGTWVHYLGVTPSALLYSDPPDSTDSSSWLGPVRFGSTPKAVAMGTTIGQLSVGFAVAVGSDALSDTGHPKASLLAAMTASSEVRCLHHFTNRRESVFS